MTTEQILCELRALYEQHKDDTYSTFEVRWKDVLYDVIQKIEELDNQLQMELTRGNCMLLTYELAMLKRQAQQKHKEAEEAKKNEEHISNDSSEITASTIQNNCLENKEGK